MLAELGEKWERVGEGGLKRTFSFSSFKNAVEFVVRVADIAEEEKEYPQDIHLRYKKVVVEIFSRGEELDIKEIQLAEQIEFAYGWKEKVERAIVTKFFTLPVIATGFLILLLIALLKHLL